MRHGKVKTFTQGPVTGTWWSMELYAGGQPPKFLFYHGMQCRNIRALNASCTDHPGRAQSKLMLVTASRDMAFQA